MVNRVLAEGSRSAAFYSAAEDAVHKCVPEPPSADAVAAKLVDSSSFTVPVTNFIKHEVTENSSDKPQIE